MFLPCLRSALRAAGLVAGVSVLAAPTPWVLSGNEAKLDLATGVTRVVPGAGPDSLTLLNFTSQPPQVLHLTNVSNTVLGPPSNIAFTPDGQLALIADSVRLDPEQPGKWRPHRGIHVLDLSVTPPQFLADVEAGLQPSGLSVASDGTFALVANRAGGSVTRLNLRGRSVVPAETVTFTVSTNEVSDVAISPDNRWALASVREASHLRLLRCDAGTLTVQERRISTYGRPYRVVFTPDGRFALTAGQGSGNGTDTDALTVIRRDGDEFRTVDFVPLGASPETLEVSPDGRLIAVILMNGSNQAPGSKGYTDHGQLVILTRQKDRFVRTQTLAVGRIPEGVAFSPDGRTLIVQSHPDRELRLYPIRRGRVGTNYERIPVPGFPSSLRAVGR